MAEFGVRMQNTSNFGKQAGRSRTRIFWGNTLRVLFILAVVVVVLIPFYISFLYSIKTHSDISLNRLAWPQHPTLENYARVIRENKYVAIGFKNSILTTVPCTLILLFTTSMASYVLARNHSKFYKVLYSLFISGILVPFHSGPNRLSGLHQRPDHHRLRKGHPPGSGRSRRYRRLRQIPHLLADHFPSDDPHQCYSDGA